MEDHIGMYMDIRLMTSLEMDSLRNAYCVGVWNPAVRNPIYTNVIKGGVFGLSIIKHVTLQKILDHDFRYDPRIYLKTSLFQDILSSLRMNAGL